MDLSSIQNITETQWFYFNKLYNQNSVNYPMRVNTFQIQGDTMYFTISNLETSEESFLSFQINKQSIPTLMDQIKLGARSDFTHQMSLYGGFAFIESSIIISIVNLKDPWNLHYEAIFNSTMRNYDFEITGSHLFIISSRGLIITDLSDIDIQTSFGINSITGFPIYSIILFLGALFIIQTQKYKQRAIRRD